MVSGAAFALRGTVERISHRNYLVAPHGGGNRPQRGGKPQRPPRRAPMAAAARPERTEIWRFTMCFGVSSIFCRLSAMCCWPTVSSGWLLPPYHKIMRFLGRLVDPLLTPVRRVFFPAVPPCGAGPFAAGHFPAAEPALAADFGSYTAGSPSDARGPGPCQKRLEELARRASGTGRPQLAGFLSPRRAGAGGAVRPPGPASPCFWRAARRTRNAAWPPLRTRTGRPHGPIAALQIAWNARQGVARSPGPAGFALGAGA